jgi:hypothetical protein
MKATRPQKRRCAKAGHGGETSAEPIRILKPAPASIKNATKQINNQANTTSNDVHARLVREQQWPRAECKCLASSCECSTGSPNDTNWGAPGMGCFEKNKKIKNRMSKAVLSLEQQDHAVGVAEATRSELAEQLHCELGLADARRKTC